MADETTQATAATTSAIDDRMKAAADQMKASGEKIAETGTQLGMRLLDQAETNTREAFAAIRAATQAKDVSEVMRVQGEFLREQGARSMTQAREIAEIITSFGRDAMGQMTRRD